MDSKNERTATATIVNELLSRIYNTKKDKLGVILTANQLYQYAVKENKLITKKAVVDFLKTQVLSARFTAPAKRPSAFQTISHPRIGVYFLDYAEFHKDWSWHNKGNTGFLVAVENITNRLFVIPCKGKATNQWEKAVETFIELVRNVRTIFTDRDAVATSPAFQKRIQELYNLKWYFLVKGSKSYLAERFIRFTKEKLSQALTLKDTKNWCQFVEPIVNEYNKEKIEGTSYSRGSISNDNFNHFLSQRFKINRNSQLKNIKLSDDPTLRINSSRIYNDFFTKSWNDSIFSFAPGDKVLIARRSDWKHNKQIAGNAFFKASHWGTFDDRVYTIASRQLRATHNFRGYVPMYALKDYEDNTNKGGRLFYASELKRVN
jgi:hypothetical protein